MNKDVTGLFQGYVLEFTYREYTKPCEPYAKYLSISELRIDSGAP